MCWAIATRWGSSGTGWRDRASAARVRSRRSALWTIFAALSNTPSIKALTGLAANPNTLGGAGEKTYRRGTSVKEKNFHDELHKRLLADPELGGRVERGEPLALGYLDTRHPAPGTRHDRITTELKVERRVPVTKASAPTYLGQPTRYAAADGARLAILAILDMSPRALPVGTTENYMFTLEPRLRGLTNPEAPSLTAVLIVNGNMPIPARGLARRRL